jgi:molybdate transport system substrate-binding protein
MKQKFVLLVAGLLWLVAGCQMAVPAEPQTVTIFAAASLTDAFTELEQAFVAANPGVSVIFNFGGSSQLAAQLAEGVPADVFASANARQMDTAVDSGRVEASAVQPFTTNQLILITPADNPAGLTRLEA